MRIVLIGSGSREFGPATVSDVLLSDSISEAGVELVLMDLNAEALESTRTFAVETSKLLGRSVEVEATTDLERALDGAAFVVMAIEARRYFYWSQDFHIPRTFGFNQIYGENGGPGGLFHALRNMGPCVEVARAMERLCPEAWLLNYTNPLTKLCQAQTQLTQTRVVGLCHGIFAGIRQVARFLEREPDTLQVEASGLNHFTWLQTIKDAASGEDLYPELKQREQFAHSLADWDEIALSRALMRTFGLYPSPGANHVGEYIGWAAEFLASQHLQFYYDPRDGDPWENDQVPPWIYNLGDHATDTPLDHPMQEGRLVPNERRGPRDVPVPSGELAVPLIEGLIGEAPVPLAAVNVPNDGHVPGVAAGAVVEVPGIAAHGTLTPQAMPELPEPVLALINRQVSINRLLVAAFEEGSRDRLLEALLLDPTAHSYRAAVQLIDAMCDRQQAVLPPLEWGGR